MIERNHEKKATRDSNLPKLKHKVITAGNPSGIAATPKATLTLA